MKLLFLDTETGGVDPYTTSLLQIAGAFYDTETKVISEHISLFIKHEIYCVTPTALRINKLDVQEIDKVGYRVSEARAKLLSFITKHTSARATLAGINVDFDKNFISHWLEIDERYISYRKLDLISIVMFLQSIGKLPSTLSLSSDSLMDYFDINKLANRHDALTDVLNSIELYKKLTELL